MVSRKDEEIERENTLWRISIKRMFQSGDLEGLIDLKEGPEILEDEILQFLDDCIEKLNSKEIGKSQAE